MDWGRALENIVFLELTRRGYEVNVGKIGDLEVDFIAVRQGEKLYIQVCEDVSRNDTLLREVRPFSKIRDAYPKVLIARTRHEEYDLEGVRMLNIADWLLSS